MRRAEYFGRVWSAIYSGAEIKPPGLRADQSGAGQMLSRPTAADAAALPQGASAVDAESLRHSAVHCDLVQELVTGGFRPVIDELCTPSIRLA